MRAVLHIGTEKTGTTSLQVFMHENRASLLQAGILYPEKLGGVNHRWIASYGLDPEAGDETFVALGLKDQDALDAFRADVEARLAEQVAAASDARICFLSSEHLHSRLRTADQVARVRDLLAGMFDEVEVHIHLRPQVDVAVSLASTSSRVGGRVGHDFFERIRARQIYYNYDLLVSTWEEVFGADNVLCLPFKTQPDFLGYIARRMDLDLTGLPLPARVNEALDVRVMAMVNALVESGTPQRIDFRVLDMLPVEQKLTLDLATARRLQARFEDSNRTLIARRHDLAPGQLQPQWSRYPEEGNLDLLDEPCVFASSLADLVRHYNGLIRDLAKTR
ncbi:hypothetical protein [Roseisalinus antarcticus]|uniref:Sulfotransferase family protein n=1 Tax=Roseisalinus antarcticus TaxID=254357 RepID=A0A1Y5TPT8_9RHOB|nr:hypothetical protein [Roseisalinus antarcticus]SLN69128.1 hypothetical protein ROA7023_03358 [Roseisalinus antarcticus]